MRRYIRADTPGATYFFTVALQDRGADHLVRHADLLRAAVSDVRRRHPFHVDAMVVLPEHVHALWTLPAGDSGFGKRWMLVKGQFTRALAAAHLLDAGAAAARGEKGERSLWQRRFWEHQIRDEDDLARHVDYIHFNPVKHGYVRRAKDWPHSSFHRFVRAGWLPAEWGVASDVPGNYGERT